MGVSFRIPQPIASNVGIAGSGSTLVEKLYTPFQPLAAIETGMLATRLSDAMSILVSMGVPVGQTSRLNRAVRVLQNVHEDGHYPSAESELIEVGNAIKLAFQLVRTIEAVHDSRPPAIIESLRRALKGRLSDTH